VVVREEESKDGVQGTHLKAEYVMSVGRERRERCNECEWVVARDMNMTEGEGQQIEQNMDEREKINTRTPEKKTYELGPNNWSGHLCCKTSLDGYLYATKSASCSTNC
jgi:hypothetical protein